MRSLSRLTHLQLCFGKLLVGARDVTARVREKIAVARSPHCHHGSATEPVLCQHLDIAHSSEPCCQPWMLMGKARSDVPATVEHRSGQHADSCMWHLRLSEILADVVQGGSPCRLVQCTLSF